MRADEACVAGIDNELVPPAPSERCRCLNNTDVNEPAKLLWFVRHTPFTGVTGRVELDDTGNRIANFTWKNFVPSSSGCACPFVLCVESQ